MKVPRRMCGHFINTKVGVRRGPARTAESSRSQNCLIQENDAEKSD